MCGRGGRRPGSGRSTSRRSGPSRAAAGRGSTGSRSARTGSSSRRDRSGRAEQRIEVGTAGGIALVLQAWLPVALEAGGAITVVGGTEVPLGPTIDFVDRVLLRFLRAHGARASLDIRRRGYVPQGGGEVRVAVEPARLAPISAARVPVESGAVSAAANLPRHVPERQLDAAAQALEPMVGPLDAAVVDLREGPSTGSSITCWIGLKSRERPRPAGPPGRAGRHGGGRRPARRARPSRRGRPPPRGPAPRLPRPVRRLVHGDGLHAAHGDRALAPREVRPRRRPRPRPRRGEAFSA